MRTLGLRARFILAGAVLVMTTVASGLWSAWTFDRLSRAVGSTLKDSEETTAATAALATALEREDDALLLSLTGATRGEEELAAGRRDVRRSFERVDALLTSPAERDAATSLQREVLAYHAAGDALLAAPGQGARERYHRDVNPLLRVAVNAAGHIRDAHFRVAQDVAAYARDETRRATFIVSLMSLGALVLSALVAFHLARAVAWPLRDLTRSVEAMRHGDFEQRVTAAADDELGRLAEGFNRMAEHLTEFRRSNLSEVLAAKETLESTLEALPDAVVVVDPDRGVASINAAASAVLGVKAGASSLAIDDLALPEPALAAVRDALAGKPGKATAVDLGKAIPVMLDGDERRLLPRVVTVPGFSGGRHGAVLVLYDVTDLVRLDEMRVELVAVASHELRTPLTTMRMTLLMLSEGASDLTPRQQELLATAVLGVEQLASTVDEFLDLTRIEAGQLRLTWDRIDAAALIAHAARAVCARCEEAGIVLRILADGLGESANAPAYVWGDAARLHVVLGNILTNAIKYTPTGGAITIRASLDAEEGAPLRSVLQISVTDTGPGIPEEFRGSVFDKFFRVEHHLAGEDLGVRGSGIGLYLSRQIIEAHGGNVRCEAGDDGRGTRIAIALPVDPPEGPPPRA